MKKGPGLAISSLLFISSCSAQPLMTALPMQQPRPENHMNRQPLPRLIRHTIIGQGKNIYEFRNGALDVMFEEGAVEGFFIEAIHAGCIFYQFSIYDFEPRGGKTDHLSINENIFQRFGAHLPDAQTDYIFKPLGYTKEDAADIFRAADKVLAAYNELRYEPTDKVIEYIDPHGPYNVLYSKSLTFRHYCKPSEEQLTPELIKKFMP